MNKVWNIAIYARVSTEKESQSESVAVQVEALKKWIILKSREDTEAIYNLIDVYADEGISGSNFNRDNFVRMKEDIEHEKINMVLTRDLSRFSRNYVLAGYYLEDYFKVKNVRFVSVLDNVDTDNDDNDIIPFKNILNEMYIKDCSRKIRSALITRMERGSSIASKPPYGYKFEEEFEGNQKTIRLVPRGDETTKVVREIFSLYSNGWGVGRIATYLNKNQVKPPSYYVKNFARKKFGVWNNNTIISILTNHKYGGIMLQGRYKKVSYKVKKVNIMPDGQCINGGEFKGIISKEEFYKTQEIMRRRSQGNYRYVGNSAHLFTGILKCDDCSGSMIYRKKYQGYKCHNSQIGGKRCTPHSIKEKDLLNIISKDLREMVNKKVDKKKNFNKYNNFQVDENYEKELESVEEELAKLDRKFKQLYEDKIGGIISEHNFSNIIKEVQNEQEVMLKKKEELLRLKNLNESDDSLVNKYREQLKDLIDLKDIDRTVIETFIDRILIEQKANSKEKTVRIFYKFSNEEKITTIKYRK